MSENRKNVSGGGVVSVLERIGEALTNTGNGDPDNDATTDAVALAKARATVEAMAEALDLLLHDRTPWSVTCAREALARYHGRTES